MKVHVKALQAHVGRFEEIGMSDRGEFPTCPKQCVDTAIDGFSLPPQDAGR